jgi:predicted phage terminase large subunit-like protein
MPRAKEQPVPDLRRWANVSTGRFTFGARAVVPATPVKPLTFRQYIEKVHPRFQWYPHCERLVALLQRVADGELLRLIVMMPPRHSKSETVSRLFTAYYLYRHPERWVGLASYAAALAYKLSRAARDFARLGGVQLRDDAEAVAEWETTSGGGLWAAGVGGPATGKGMHLGILDDPIKNAEEAASDVIADRNRDWWNSTWYTRQEPGAALVVIMTRWPGPGDLVGWLFQQEEADDQPERWHVVSLEAEKTEEPVVVPPSCTVEHDPRAPGEALCPERYPIEKIRKIAARIGSFFFGSLFQQRSVHREGKMFKWEWWQIIPAEPVCQTLVRYWDLAGTEPKKKGHDPDYTASTLAGRMPDQRTAILDVSEFRESVGQRDAKIESIALEDRAKYGLRVQWWFEKEAGIGGEDRMTSLVRRIQALGITVHVEPATGSKILRAEPLAAAAEAKNVVLGPDNPKRPWRERFRTHMADFSKTCAHDDIADSASGAFNKLSAPTAGVGFSSLSI